MNIKLFLYLVFPVGFLCGCSPKQTSIPANAPLIGKPMLLSEQGKSDYTIGLLVCNRKKDKLKVELQIVGKTGEVLHADAGIGLSGNYDMMFGVGRIKAKRTAPIYMKVKWRRGNEQGVERFVITPGQDNKA